MIMLRDSITIQTKPEQLFKWLELMPQEYCSWHSDHVACRVIHGSMLQRGSEIECQEYLHGKLHILQFRLTRVDPCRRMEYEIAGLGNPVEYFFLIVPDGVHEAARADEIGVLEQDGDDGLAE